MTSEQASFLLTSVSLPSLAAEQPITKSVIAAIPAEKVDYRPDDIVRSAVDLAWHIVTVEVRFMNAASTGAFDLTPMPRPDTVRSGGDVNRWYDREFGAAIEKLTRASGDQLIRIVDFRGIFQLPAVVYLDVGLRHSVHHRGQLSMYLRPMGAKVPSIYGESHDARIAREAATAR